MYVTTTTRLLFYDFSIRRPFLVLRLFWTLPSFTFALTQGWRSLSFSLYPTSIGSCEREPGCAWAWRRASSTKRARSSIQSVANSEALRLAAQECIHTVGNKWVNMPQTYECTSLALQLQHCNLQHADTTCWHKRIATRAVQQNRRLRQSLRLGRLIDCLTQKSRLQFLPLLHFDIA